MEKYTIDTNVFVDAIRTEAGSHALEDFLLAHLPRTYLHSVVAMELRAGARSTEQVVALQGGLLEPFFRRDRVLVPGIRSFVEAGRICATLNDEGWGRSRRPPTIVVDALIAASCCANGVTLVTRDVDFARIASHLRGFRYVAPWPV